MIDLNIWNNKNCDDSSDDFNDGYLIMKLGMIMILMDNDVGDDEKSGDGDTNDSGGYGGGNCDNNIKVIEIVTIVILMR